MALAMKNTFKSFDRLKDSGVPEKQARVIRLHADDRKIFVQAILNPSPPNAALHNAVTRYQKAIK